MTAAEINSLLISPNEDLRIEFEKVEKKCWDAIKKDGNEEMEGE